MDFGHDIKIDRNARANRLAQEIQHIGYELLNLNGFELEFLAPGKCQQSFRQARAPLGSLDGAVQQPGSSWVVWKSLFQQREAAQNHRKQIIEIVSHTAGQFSDAFHFLRFEKLSEHDFPFARAFDHARFQLFVASEERVACFDKIHYVCRGSEPAAGLSVGRPHGYRSELKPAVGAVRTAKARIGVEYIAGM